MTYPVLNPFPWDQTLPDDAVTGWETFYDGLPTLDGTQLNVRLGGDSLSWTATGAPPSKGVFYDLGLPGTNTGFTSRNELYLDGGNRSTGSPYGDLNLWDLGSFPVTNTDVYSRYVISDQTASSPAVYGLKAYPGMCATGANYWGGWIQAVNHSRPVSFEMWYSSNPSPSAPDIGFNGYTIFGDQGQWLPEFLSTGQGTDYVRKYIAGIFKSSADISNPSISDMVCAVQFDGTVSGGTGILVVNGTIVDTITLTSRPTSIRAWVDTAWGGFKEDLNGLAGALTYIGIEANFDLLQTPTLVDKNYSSLTPSVQSFDTNDVKFGWYVDQNTGLGDGVPAYNNAIYTDVPSMFTYPGWTLVTVIGDGSTPTRILVPLSMVRYFTEADPYYYKINNRPSTDLAKRDIELIDALQPISSIDSPPSFLGQKALVGGVMYFGVDTVTVDDWKSLKVI